MHTEVPNFDMKYALGLFRPFEMRWLRGLTSFSLCSLVLLVAMLPLYLEASPGQPLPSLPELPLNDSGQDFNESELLTNYFDISPGDSTVSGRVNVSANRYAIDFIEDGEGDFFTAGVRAADHYTLNLLAHDVFELEQKVDTAGRLFGVLNVKDSATLGALGTVYGLTVELVDVQNYSAPTVAARETFQVNVISETVLGKVFDHAHHFVSSKNSRMWGRHNYDAADVAEIVAEIGTERSVAVGVDGNNDPIFETFPRGAFSGRRNRNGSLHYASGTNSQGDPILSMPFLFYLNQTETEMELYGGFDRSTGSANGGRSILLGDELMHSANIIGGLAKFYTSTPSSELKAAIYDALELYLRVFPVNVFPDTRGVSYSDRTHAWVFSDPISGALVMMYRDLEADAADGYAQAEYIIDRGRYFNQVATWGVNEAYRVTSNRRYYDFARGRLADSP